MAEKKATKKRSVRYLLSADRRLQKLSLKKISDRLRPSKARVQAARSKDPAAKEPAAAAASTPPSSMRWAIGAGLVVVIVGAVMMSATPPDPLGEPESELAAAPAEKAERTEKAEQTGKTEQTGKIERTGKTERTEVPGAVTSKPSPTTSRVTDATTSAGADPTPAPTAGQAASVTIVGCLQRDGDTFWLKDTSGDDAPKARSWKTGFLTRRSSRVDVVDARRALQLATHVGERVAATGALVNRELQAQSLRRVAASCH